MTDTTSTLPTVYTIPSSCPVTQDALQNAVANAHAAQIVTAQDMEAGAELTRILRTMGKKIDEWRRTLVDPLNDQVKAINAAITPLRTQAEDGQIALGQKMNSWQAGERRRAAAEAERIRKEQEDAALAKAQEAEREAAVLREAGKAQEAEQAQAKADHIVSEAIDAPAPAVAVQQTHRGYYGAVASTRKVWQFDVKDFDAIPRRWLMLDETAVRTAIRQAKAPVREIPGLRIFETETVVTR